MILLAAGWFVSLIFLVLAVISILLIVIVLMQDSKAGGLSGFGAQGGETILGARGQKDLARITTYLAIGFFVLSCLGSRLEQNVLSGSSVRPPEPAAPAVSPGVPENAQGSTGPMPPPGGAATTTVTVPPPAEEPGAKPAGGGG